MEDYYFSVARDVTEMMSEESDAEIVLPLEMETSVVFVLETLDPGGKLVINYWRSPFIG